MGIKGEEEWGQVLSPKSLQKLAHWKIYASETGSKLPEHLLPSLCSILTIDSDGLGFPRGLTSCPAEVWAIGGQHMCFFFFFFLAIVFLQIPFCF